MVNIINEVVLNEYRIVDVLENRYGDGTVYVPANDDDYEYYTAKKKGYISNDGHITRKGKHLLTKYMH